MANFLKFHKEFLYMFFTGKVWGGVPILDTSSLSSGSTTAYSIYWRFFVSMAHKVQKEIAMGLHPSTFSIGFNH